MAKSVKQAKAPKSIFTLTEENRKKLPVLAAIEGRNMQDIVNEALADYIAKYEKKKGTLPTK
jgi:hypothetical protein